MTGDDEVFEELQKLAAPPHREPPPESVAALRAAVAGKFSGPKKRPWWQQKITVGAAVFGLMAATPAAAFALGGASLPDPMRTALHAMGLPVDSVPVADTKATEGDLERALRDRNEVQITKAADHLKTCLAGLDRADRSRLAPNAEALLSAAASAGGGDEHPQAASDQPGPGGISGSGSDQVSTPDATSGSDGSSSNRDGADGDTNRDNGANHTGRDGSPDGSGDDGDDSATTTLPPAQSPGDGQTATTTTQSSGDGGSDSSGDGGSGSSGDGGSGSSAHGGSDSGTGSGPSGGGDDAPTTVEQSH